MTKQPKKKIKRRTKMQKSSHPAIEVRSAQREIRNYQSTKLSVRKAATGEMQLIGTAIVFDSPSQDLGGFTEIVKRQSVQKSLQRNNDVFMLWQHDSSQPLSRVKTGSLKLTLTDVSLDFVATMPSSPLGQNAYQAVSDGTVDSVSFGFGVEPGGEKWLEDERGNLVRELWDINVAEISPVTWAAYLAPHVDTRSCPVALRSKLTLTRESDDADVEDETEADSSDEQRCDCDCPECLDGDCSECSDPDCDDPDCYDEERCPNQLRQAHFELLQRRFRS